MGRNEVWHYMRPSLAPEFCKSVQAGFFVAKVRAWNLVKRVIPALWIWERGICPAPSQAPAAPVTFSAKHGKFVVLWKSTAPFVLTAHFTSPSLHRGQCSGPSFPTHCRALKPKPCSWRSAGWLCGVSLSSLTADIDHLSYVCSVGGEKIEVISSVFTSTLQDQLSSGEQFHLLCLEKQWNDELPSANPARPSVCALSSSCAILPQKRGCGYVWHEQHEVLGILLQLVMMTEPKPKWFVLPEWVPGHFLPAEGLDESFWQVNWADLLLTLRKWRWCPTRELFKQLLETPALCDTQSFLWWCDFDRDEAAAGWAHLMSSWRDQVGTRVGAWWGQTGKQRLKCKLHQNPWKELQHQILHWCRTQRSVLIPRDGLWQSLRVCLHISRLERGISSLKWWRCCKNLQFRKSPRGSEHIWRYLWPLRFKLIHFSFVVT